MPTSLSQQAIRMRRADWGDRAQLLSEELYLIFLTQKPIDFGNMNVTFPDGTNPIVLPDRIQRGPFGDFTFPDLMFPDLLLPELQPIFSEDLDSPEDPVLEDGEQQRKVKKRIRTQIQHLRAAMPGQILGGDGPSYDVALYPNGSTGGSFSQAVTEDPITGAISGGALDLNFSINGKITADTWALVFRHMKVQVKTTEFVEFGPKKEEKILRVESESTVLQINNEFASGGSGGGGNAFPGYVLGGIDDDYTVSIITPAGSEVVNATQLQIASGEQIPVGTGCIVVRIINTETGVTTHYMQVPVWLNG